MRVKSSGMARGLANARPPGSAKFANAPPPGLTRRANAPLGAGGGWAQVELTDAKHKHLLSKSKAYSTTSNEHVSIFTLGGL